MAKARINNTDQYSNSEAPESMASTEPAETLEAPPETPQRRTRGSLRVKAAPSRKRIKLETPMDALKETARLYREMREGRIDHAAARGMVWVLAEARKMMETAVIMARVEAMEAAMAAGHPAPQLEHLEGVRAEARADEQAQEQAVTEMIMATDEQASTLRTYSPEQLAEMTRQD